MEYVIGLFADRHQADESIKVLKTASVPGDEYVVKDRENWLEHVFDMQEPQATMEAHGLQRETSEWLDKQIESGRVMVVVRTSDPDLISRVLTDAGASHIQREKWFPGREPSVD
jgi:hypothetical protein